jgi:hypothetical protein
MLVLDKVGRIQQVIDSRTSYLSSAPNLGSGMTESVADATKRLYFQNNYYVPRTSALTAQIPQDWNLPSPGFMLGGGSVSVPGIGVVSSPQKYFSTATNGGLLTNAITQIYVSPTTGTVATQAAVTSGVFPANCLAICEVTTDATGLIRNIVDWRPSYI